MSGWDLFLDKCFLAVLGAYRPIGILTNGMPGRSALRPVLDGMSDAAA